MEFPAELRGEVERLLSEENTDKLAKAAEGISARYRGNDGSGKRLGLLRQFQAAVLRLRGHRPAGV